MKKKKRIDPAILRRRFERKTRKMQKEIRRLEKVKKTPKPVLELQVPKEIFMEKKYDLFTIFYILKINNYPNYLEFYK